MIEERALRCGSWLDLLYEGLCVKLIIGFGLLSLSKQSCQMLLQEGGALLCLSLLLFLNLNHLEGLSNLNAVSIDRLHTQDV